MCMCTCVYVHVCVHVSVCVHVCVCVYVCMYVYACGGVSKDIFEEMVISFHSVLQRWNSGHCAPMTSADTL